MPDNKLKSFYDAVSEDYDLPDYATFEKDMSDDTKRKAFYDNVATDYELPDYDTFTTDMVGKKKWGNPIARFTRAIRAFRAAWGK